MREEKIIAMMQQIEDYVLGRLRPSEIDRLWIEFLKKPEWYSYFLALIHLYAMAESTI